MRRARHTIERVRITYCVIDAAMVAATPAYNKKEGMR